MTSVGQQLLEQLGLILKAYGDCKRQSKYDHQSKYDDLSDIDDAKIVELITRSTAAVERASGPTSVYARQIQDILARDVNDSVKMRRIMGVVQSLYADIENGHLQSVSELIHGEVFSDFLEMADYLLTEGYKDAAVVMAGGTLEAHLRKLCIKNSIPIDIQTSNGTQPKKADGMNADLAGASVISKLDQKNVTSWLDLRNKAAHAQYSEYTKGQVVLMTASVRDFITRIPA